MEHWDYTVPYQGKLCQLNCCWKTFHGVFAHILKPLTNVRAMADNEGMDFMKVIQERRSIRKYKDTPVPDEIIREVLEAARRSPSWANTQVWRFIVVKDQDIKAASPGYIAAYQPRPTGDNRSADTHLHRRAKGPIRFLPW